MRKGVIAANWKMHGTKAATHHFVDAIEKLNTNDVDIIFSPPALYLAEAKAATNVIALAAQNASQYPNGAYTGELSMQMLADIGCQYVILGHSERRQYFQENDGIICEKVISAFDQGLTPILCIGEQDSENQAGETAAVLQRQLEHVIDKLTKAQKQKIILAYEPVWAIGTGRTPSIDDIEKIHQKIRSLFSQNDDTIANPLRILYGGSVKPENASDIFACPNVDGALVGGASLQIESFTKIIKAY